MSEADDLEQKNYERAISKYMAQAAIRIATNITKPEFLAEIEKSLSPKPFGVVKIKNTKNHYRLHFPPSSTAMVQILKQTMPFLKVGQHEIKNLDFCPKVEGKVWTEQRAYDYVIFVDPYYTLDIIRTKLQAKGVEILLINHDFFCGFRTGWTRVKATSKHNDDEISITIADSSYSLILLATKIRKANIAKVKKLKQIEALSKKKEKANPTLEEWSTQGRKKNKQTSKKKDLPPTPKVPSPPSSQASLSPPNPPSGSLAPLPPKEREIVLSSIAHSTEDTLLQPGTTDKPPLNEKKLKKKAKEAKKKEEEKK